MNSFESIEEKIFQFATDQQGKVHKDAIVYQGSTSEKVQERRVLWTDGIIGKGVIIEPNYKDKKRWDFLIIAWADDKNYTDGIPFLRKYIRYKVNFSEIEIDLDKLFLESIQNFESITFEDLKLTSIIKINRSK